MRRRSVIVLAASAAALSALAFGLLRKGHDGRDAQGLELTAPAIGREAVLHVAWHEKSTARLQEAQAAGLADTYQGELDLDANLVLSRETTTDGADVIRAELRDVRASNVVVSGQKVLASDETGRKMLEKRPVYLVVDGARVVRVLVDKDAPSLAVQLTENVARQVLLPAASPEATFEREEQRPSGTFRVKYERAKSDTYARTIASAVSVEGLPDACVAPCAVRARGEGEVTFDGAGPLARFSEKREIHAGAPGAPAMFETTASFEATRVKESDGAIASLDTSALASKLPGEPFESQAEKRAALERRAAGATIEDVVSGIDAVGTAGPEGLAKGWLVRSTALLELHPELQAEVAIRFEDDAIGAGGRTAILDLLASTGGEAAQATLLRVLDGSTARSDEQRLTYLQRLMLVEEPSIETAKAIRDRLGKSESAGDAQMAYAEAHVLGATAGRLAKRGEQREAKAATDLLASKLDAAEAPAARAAYVSALGNAGDRAQVARIGKHASDADPAVRRAVASALRKTHEPAARGTLMRLAKDADEDVQTAAIDALGHHPMEKSDQRELASLLDTPQLGGEAEASLVSILLRQGSPSPEVRGSLEHLLARTEDPRLAARVRFALEAAN
ncbi:MAG: HEAT repeat domain-containing protein [Labilithrix sp.]|nr:HEAT repeat domain-containing protein [Labilithrix sp.]